MKKHKIFVILVCFFLGILTNQDSVLLSNTFQTGNLPTDEPFKIHSESEKPDEQSKGTNAEQIINNIVSSLWQAVDANDAKQLSRIYYSQIFDSNNFNPSNLILNLVQERTQIASQYKQDITKVFDVNIQGDRAKAFTKQGGEKYIYYFVKPKDKWFLYSSGFGTDDIWPRTQLDNQAFNEYLEAGNLLLQGMDRAKLAERFLSIGNKYSVTDTGKICTELGILLTEMTKEDKAFVEPNDVQQLSAQEKINYYIFKLRDVAEQEMFIPGKCYVLRDPRTPNSAAATLRKMGNVVVPAMIALLQDHRPTRSVGQARNGGVVLRYCDIALEILADIANKNLPNETTIFDPRTERGAYLSNADEKTTDEIIRRVNQWWEQNNKDKFYEELLYLQQQNPAVFGFTALIEGYEKFISKYQNDSRVAEAFFDMATIYELNWDKRDINKAVELFDKSAKTAVPNTNIWKKANIYLFNRLLNSDMPKAEKILLDMKVHLGKNEMAIEAEIEDRYVYFYGIQNRFDEAEEHYAKVLSLYKDREKAKDIYDLMTITRCYIGSSDTLLECIGNAKNLTSAQRLRLLREIGNRYYVFRNFNYYDMINYLEQQVN
jgi:hypothetical protein